jgi:dihydrodipicolinate reductase
MAEEEVTLARLDERMDHLQAAQKQQADAMIVFTQSLRTLSVIEYQQTQILQALSASAGRMDDIDKRVRTIEEKLPGLVEVRRWVIAGMLAAVGMMGMALMQLAVWGPAQERVSQEKALQQLLQNRGVGP